MRRFRNSYLAAAVFCCLMARGFAASSEVADAAMHKDKTAIRVLLENKADVNAPQPDGTTALHWAARWDDLEMAAMLIRAGADAQAANRIGTTPLFLATANGSGPMIEALLAAGADPNAPVLSHGETPLMMAGRTGKLDAVEVLLRHGARSNVAENLRGTTALMWAAEQGHAQVVELLINNGADVNAQSKVIRPIRRNGLSFDRTKDGKPNGDPIGGLTPLLFAARQGSLETVRKLLAAGADLKKYAVDGTGPLVVAVQNGNYDIARLFIEQGADINQANEKGWTPLYLAVSNRNAFRTAVPPPSSDGALDFIQLLLNRGADPNHRIKFRTEVHQANSALWLQEAGATALLRASLCGDLAVVKLLLAHGADPLIPTFDHTTPLMAASGVGWAEGFTFQYSDDETIQLVKLLLETGAQVNEANDHGITALHGAAYMGANDVVQLLVGKGADLSAKDKGEDFGFGVSSVKMTPLNWAEGVPIGMSSAIFHPDTVDLITRLMQERGIPVVYNTFHGVKETDPEIYRRAQPEK